MLKLLSCNFPSTTPLIDAQNRLTGKPIGRWDTTSGPVLNGQNRVFLICYSSLTPIQSHEAYAGF